MDEIKTNVPKTFRYLIVLTALVAMAVGYTFLPDAEVSAQVETKSGVEAAEPEVATQAMIDYALNLKSASEYTVYAERGVVERGNNEIKGGKASALRSAAGRKSTKELSNSIDALRQLPCSEVKSLTGRTFTPGVYCLNGSAELNGEMVIDGEGSAAGSYIFRVAGTLNAKSGSSIRLENGAQGGNVFFVAAEAEIANDVAFRASILSDGDIKIGSGSTVTNKVMSLGNVELDNSSLMGGTTGSLEICKEQQLPVTAANDLSNYIFHYVITGVAAGAPGSAGNPLRVPVGSCSSPIDVTQGPQTVTELNSGTLITPATGTFTGNFELINVANLTPASPSTLGLVNLATRVANINVVAGGVNTQLTLEFTNRKTITGFVEICKRAATGPGTFNPAGANPLSGGDPDVTGFFNYTISQVFSVNQQNPNVRTLQVFTIPVGQCTGAIAVSVGSPAPFGTTPESSGVIITELGRAGFYLENIEVFPTVLSTGQPTVAFAQLGVGATAESGQNLFTFPNPGGGLIGVRFVESTSAANETLVTFVNRSNPSRLKVCKIAGPGIPINTLFSFTVSGFGATNAAAPQFATYGPVTRTFDVRAGDPAQGGTCEFVPGFGANAPGYAQFQTFVNGTAISIVENGVSINNTIPQQPGQLRVSQIRVFGSTFTSPGIAGFAPNPDLTPGTNNQTFSTGNIAVPITDNTTVDIPVSVPAPNAVTDINVRVRLDHSFDGDLELRTIHPDGTNVLLSDNRGGTGDNFGTGANTCAGTPTTFDDEAATGIAAGVAPFSGSFRPEGTPPGPGLGAFDGRALNGTWQFRVADQASLDQGTVGCVSLDIASSYVGRAAVFARASIVEVEFSNFRFTPTILKVCKKAGTPNLLGVNFNFTVALVSPQIGGANPGPMFPPFSQNVSVTAGPNNSQEGNCAIVNGSGLLGGAFNVASTITITEAAQGSSTVSAITCPSCNGGFTPNLPLRQALLNGPGGLVAGINSVIFTNNDAGDRPPVTKFDFDGDGKADPAVWTPATGTWYWRSSAEGGEMKVRPFGAAGDKLVAADYDGDGRTDYAVYRPSEGRWYFQGTTGVFEYHNWGQPGDIPQTGDYDGDGKSDFIIFRPSTGTWYVKTISGNFAVFQFGIPTDRPMAADYDGDGRTDAGVFRNGTWYTLESTRGFRVTQFGQAGDVPVAADYDGDDAADFGVFRNGTWYMLTATNYIVKQHGQAGDTAVPADYDGDGIADLAVFRASEGKWYIKRSSLNESSDVFQFGTATDDAVQAQ